MQQEMKYIYTIYQEGSFSKAAEKLYVTQSTLSMAVQRVEHSLGNTLFDRSKRPLKLTPVGKLYIQKYAEISLLEKELFDQINDLSNLEKGSLTIGGTGYILSYILAPVLSRFTRQHPQIELQLIECSSNQLNEKLLDGSIDICLKSDEVQPPLETHGHAFYDHLLLAMPQSYMEKFDIPRIGFSREHVINGSFQSKEYECLAPIYWNRIPLLLLTPGNNLRTRALKLFEEHSISPNVCLEIQQMLTAYHLVANGFGATLTTELIIQKNLDTNAVYYKLDSPLMTRDFQFIMGKRGYLSKAAIKFMEMTKSFYQENLPGNP